MPHIIPPFKPTIKVNVNARATLVNRYTGNITKSTYTASASAIGNTNDTIQDLKKKANHLANIANQNLFSDVFLNDTHVCGSYESTNNIKLELNKIQNKIIEYDTTYTMTQPKFPKNLIKTISNQYASSLIGNTENIQGLFRIIAYELGILDANVGNIINNTGGITTQKNLGNLFYKIITDTNYQKMCQNYVNNMGGSINTIQSFAKIPLPHLNPLPPISGIPKDHSNDHKLKELKAKFMSVITYGVFVPN